MKSVQIIQKRMSIPTYIPAEYETLPMFAENRVHQRSSGNPYPNPIVNDIRQETLIDKEYDVIILENDFLYLEILPEIGGRIFTARDKTNGYDFFYSQHVIKPALIGMLGLWISGGIEFNWPVHHRPSTFLPVDTTIEYHESGAVTVWMGEHEPLDRMKGMFGIHLSPESALFETKVRLFNRTNLPHSFLWWENAAVPVNEQYRLFFPPDVTYVQFHYKKASGGYPVMEEFFNTQDNRKGVDIRLHKNTEQATSYFSGTSLFDFFGGYDEGKHAGVVHYASHHTSVGKKLFTWGYRKLSKTWESALTDDDGAYAELMASSYSDNQPDFSWLEPFEVKEFSQSWYPYKEIGEIHQANNQMALSVDKDTIGLYPVKDCPGLKLSVFKNGILHYVTTLNLQATKPYVVSVPQLEGFSEICLTKQEEIILTYRKPPVQSEPFIPSPKTDYPQPCDLETADDCFATGLHVTQYRDPIREATVYWQRGIELNPNHAGCLTGLGWYHLARFRFAEAQGFLEQAYTAQTLLNPNPPTSWTTYLLGLAWKEQGMYQQATELLHKGMWNRSGIPSCSLVLAQIACIQEKYGEALSLLQEGARWGGYNQKGEQLQITILRKLGRVAEAKDIIRTLISEDRLDYYALNEARLLGEPVGVVEKRCNQSQMFLDIASDYLDAGLIDEAATLLAAAPQDNPMLVYLRAYITKEPQLYQTAQKISDQYCFPSRKWEFTALTEASQLMPINEQAFLLLGNLQYGVAREHLKAHQSWEKAGTSVQALRNQAIARFSCNQEDELVCQLMEKSIARDPTHIQLRYEYLRVLELQGVDPRKRSEVWEAMGKLKNKRDDVYLSGIHAYNQAGEFEKALALLKSHRFIPCEGGEHAVANEYLLANLGLACAAIIQQDWIAARALLQQNFRLPDCLGGGVWHQVMLTPYRYLEGLCSEQIEIGSGKEAFNEVYSYPINYFTSMYLPSFPIWKALSAQALGKVDESTKELQRLTLDYKNTLKKPIAGYFAATPFFECFIENPKQAQEQHFSHLLALCQAANNEYEPALDLCDKLLKSYPQLIRTKLLRDFLESDFAHGIV